MGRNQIDLLLLLSTLLIGSLYYSQNLKKQIELLKPNYIEAKKENQQALESGKLQLIGLADQYPNHQAQLKSGINKLDQVWKMPTFALSDKKQIKKLHKEIIKLAPFSDLKASNYNNLEQLYGQTINTGIDFFKKKKKERKTEFTILVESIEEQEDYLNLTILPFHKFEFDDDELYAITDLDTSLVSAHNFIFEGSFQQTLFAIQDKPHGFIPVSQLNKFQNRL